ncbi:SseB family protein [Micromonospora sp. NPDC003197]
MTDWQPATEVETAMAAAVEASDRDAFLAAFVGGPLLLPVSPEAAAGRAQLAWPTGVFDGLTHVIAFTSPEAIATCMPGESVSYRLVSLTDVVDSWPDDTWWLAVDPGLPIGLRLSVGELRELPDPAAVEAEAALRDAIIRQDPDLLAAALLKSEIIVPLRPDGSESRDLTDPEFPWWCLPDAAGDPALSVFTSEARLHQALGDHDFVVVSSYQLAESWPDPAWQLSINPGTVLATTVPGESVLALGNWLGQLRTVVTDAAEDERSRLVAAEQDEPVVPSQRSASSMAEDDDEDVEPDPDVPLTLQMVIPPQYLPSYLDQGYDRAAGLVHAWRGPGRDTPVRLYRRLGLLGEGSPFTQADEWAAVVRWAPDEETPAEWGQGKPRMEALVVPDGAGLYRIHRDGNEEPLARFDANARRWLPVTTESAAQES